MEIGQIQKMGEELARKYNPDKLSPFPFENILQDRGDVVIYLVGAESLSDDISGTIGYNQEKKEFEVFVNEDKSKVRQYFTIAHELGHYFLHKDLVKKEELLIDGDVLEVNALLYQLDEQVFSRIEIEANQFAASILMPEVLLKDAWKRLGSIEECAKVFNVPSVAMSIRLEKLGLVV